MTKRCENNKVLYIGFFYNIRHESFEIQSFSTDWFASFLVSIMLHSLCYKWRQWIFFDVMRTTEIASWHFSSFHSPWRKGGIEARLVVEQNRKVLSKRKKKKRKKNYSLVQTKEFENLRIWEPENLTAIIMSVNTAHTDQGVLLHAGEW